ILEHNIHSGCQCPDNPPPGLRTEIDGDAFLSAVLLREVHGQSANPRLRGAGEIALRRFDLDDTRPQVSERLPARRARQHARQVQHQYTVERLRPSHAGRGVTSQQLRSTNNVSAVTAPSCRAPGRRALSSSARRIADSYAIDASCAPD